MEARPPPCGAALEVGAHDHVRGQEALADAGGGDEERVAAAHGDVPLVAADQAPGVEPPPHLDDVAAEVASSMAQVGHGAERARSRQAAEQKCSLAAVDRRDQRVAARNVLQTGPHQSRQASTAPRAATAGSPDDGHEPRRGGRRAGRASGRVRPAGRARPSSSHPTSAGATVPTVKPAPTAASSTRSPFFRRFCVERGGQGEGDGGGGGVAVLLRCSSPPSSSGRPKRVADGVDDAQVGLVGDEEVEVGGGEAVALEEAQARLRELAHRVLEDVRRRPGGRSAPCGPPSRARPGAGCPRRSCTGGRPPEPSTSLPKSMMPGVVGGGLEQHRPRPVAEEHAGGAVL